MSINKAAKATRRYAVWRKKTASFVVSAEPVDLSACSLPTFKTRAQAQAACDRLNLIAVLEALREPSSAMVKAAEKACGLWEGFLAENGWRAMIDAAIDEAKETRQ